MKRTLFNNSIKGDLSATFARNIATVDDLGLPVLANAPRYARDILVGSEPAEAVALTTAEQTLLMGTGMNADGATQHTILLQRYAAGKPMRVYAGSDLATPLSSRNLARADDANYADLLRGLPNESAGAIYTPYAVVICHGLWLAACSRYTGSAGAWTATGFSIWASQDLGASWSEVYTPADWGSSKDGGQYWAFTTYYPLRVDAQDRPLDAIFVPVDYRANGGSPGGTLAVIRATRATAAHPWDIQPAHGYRLAVAGMHFHCAGVAHKADQDRADILIFAGDSNVNEVIRLMWQDVSTSMDPTAATIVEQRGFHGGGSSPHLWANQAVSCVAGPDAGSLLVTGDETGDAISLIVSPDAVDAKGSFERIWGVTHRENWGITTLIIRTLRPELRKDYFSAVMPAGGGAGTVPPVAMASRYLYSADGRQWIQRAVPSGLGGTDAREMWPMGSKFTWACNASEGGVRQAAWPTVRELKPLRLGPGGTNLIPATAFAAPFKGGTNQATKCSKDANGLWINPYTNLPFDPQPPAKSEVWRLVGDGSNATIAQFTNLFTIAGSTWWFRCWTWRGSYDNSAGNDIAFAGYPRQNGRTLGNWYPVAFCRASTGAKSPLFNQVGAKVTDYCVAFDAAVDQAMPPGYPLTPGAANPHESLSLTLTSIGSQWTIATAIRIPEDGWDNAAGDEYPTVHRAMTLFCVYADANNHVVAKVDGESKAMTFTVTRAGAVEGTITIANCWATRGDILRVAIAQDADSIDVSVIGFSGIQTGTLATTLAAAPTEWRNIAPDNTLGTIDLIAVAVDPTAYDSAARTTLLRGASLYAPFAAGRRLVEPGLGLGLHD